MPKDPVKITSKPGLLWGCDLNFVVVYSIICVVSLTIRFHRQAYPSALQNLPCVTSAVVCAAWQQRY